MILILDNRDSFTFNLAQALQELGPEVRVVRSTEVDAAGVFAMGPAGIVVGPGPGTPAGAGCSVEVLRRAARGPAPPPPVLGICLGHQALAVALGGALAPARTLVHGAARPVTHDGRGLFEGLPSPLPVARYNSLAVDPDQVPDDLEVTAHTGDGDIAGLRHRTRPIESVQGHPESVLCLEGGARELFAAFLRVVDSSPRAR